jgi:hypothetical protein
LDQYKNGPTNGFTAVISALFGTTVVQTQTLTIDPTCTYWHTRVVDFTPTASLITGLSVKYNAPDSGSYNFAD